MRAFTALVAAILATVVAANDFIKPAAGDTVPLGGTYTIFWNPTTSGSVSLILGHGSGSSFVSSFTIADNVINKDGFYAWPVSSTIVPGSGFVIELLVADGTNSQATYSPEFAIGTAAASASSSSAVSSSSSASSSSASSSSASASSGSTTSLSTSASITSSISASLVPLVSSNSSSTVSVASLNSTISSRLSSSTRTTGSASASGSASRTSSSSTSTASTTTSNAGVQGAVMWNAGAFVIAGLGAFALL